MVRTVCEDIGLAVVAAGVALINVPAGIIVGGLFIVLAANVHDTIRRRQQPVDEPCQCGHGESAHREEGHRGCRFCWCGAFHPPAVDPDPELDPVDQVLTP